MKRTPLRLFLVAPALFFSFFCTNYSSQATIVNPVIILRIEKEGTGHIVTVAAQNVEISFAGYAVFQASSEAGVRSQTAVTAANTCFRSGVLPNQAIEYIMEIKPGQTTVTAGTSNRICAAPVGLTPGNFLGIRSLQYQSLTNIVSGDISNTVFIP